jgi:potassium efflux system protein
MRFPLYARGIVQVSLWCALATLLASPGVGQEVPDTTAGEAQTQPAATTPPVVPQPTLSLAELQLLLKQAQEAPDLAEEAKARAVNSLTQAVQQLEVAEQWAAKAAEFEAERRKAPETLQAIQAELATPPSEPQPEVPADASRADLEQQLRQAQGDLEAERKTQADWERERDRRTARRREVPDLLTAARTRLQALAEASAAPEAEQPATVRLAQQALNQARRLAIEREIEGYNAELLSYDGRRDLLQARLDRAARRVAYAEKLAGALQRLVQERAQQESEAALREAREQLKRAHPAIKPLAEARESLALRVREVQAESKQAGEQLAEMEALLAQLSQDFDKIVRRVNATGLTNAIGQLLRRHRGSLPSLRPFERNLRLRRDRIGAVQLAMMELEDRRAELLNADALVADIVRSSAAAASAEQQDMIRQTAQETIVALRADIGSLVREYDRLFDRLVDLDSREVELVKTVQRFEEYVNAKILWTKSAALPSQMAYGRVREASAWLLDPAGWVAVIGSVGGTWRASPVPTLVGLVALAALWLASPRLLRRVRETGEGPVRPSQDSMGRTIAVLLATAALSVRWPATLWFAAWLSASPYDATDFSRVVAAGLRGSALIVLTLESLRQLTRGSGLAERHFRWNVRALRLVNRNLAWLTAVLVPTYFIFTTLEAHTSEGAKESLGRLAFLVAFLAIALFAQRVLKPAGPVLGPILQRRPGSWLYRLRHVWYLLGLALPVALVIAALLGYFYTALYLGMRVIETVWLLLGLIVLRALVERWLLLHTRRRAITEARERLAQRREQKEGESSGLVEPEALVPPDDKLDLASINKQTLQLVRVALIVVGVGVLWGIWAQALPALGMLREMRPLWTVTQQVSRAVQLPDGGTRLEEFTEDVPITVADLGLAGLIALITVVAVRNVPGLLEITILQRLPMDAGGRFAATAVARYVLTVVGVVVAFGQLGVGWSKVQWLVAAMTVGLGFGLQEIFANLVSGLMLLFERPIRIGDTVTVGDTSGTVARIRTRATTIVGWDRKELIVPNKEFITGRVMNWTLSDSVLRLVVPVGIAYGSDTRLAREVLMRVAQSGQHVLREPAPRVLFMGFGESALNFEVRVYVGALDCYLSTLDDINTAIDDEFRRAGIEIAFPQRDIHVRSIQGALPIFDPPAEQSARGDA